MSIVNLAPAQGHEVVCINRGLHRPFGTAQGKPVPDGARLIQVDRHDRERFEQLMQAEKFDAAKAFAGVLDKPGCIGQSYNVVRREYITWADYHRAAMQVLGREVGIVGVPFTTLQSYDIPDFDICAEIFAHHVYYSPEKLFRDVPEFQPTVSLVAGMAQVIAAMDADGRIAGASTNQWEDAIISAQKQVRP
ncbi:MAG: hypothetical protein ACE5EY_04300 [Anaerolineae bacterium]